MTTVERQERGWGGHFCASPSCLFRRNTLLTCGETRIVVSTVGNYRYNDAIQEIGFGRYYETMAFHSHATDTKYHDADVGRQIDFDSPWSIEFKDGDIQANEMHETVVAEIARRLQAGDTF